MQYFKGKNIWITGASSGIGEALSVALSQQGARLILSSRRSEELLRVKNACSNPDQIRIIPLDLSDSASFPDKVREAISSFGHIDIMVHNGGIGQHSYALDTAMSVQRKVMEVDYFSYIDLTCQLLPHFQQRRSGHFVVMSSVMGKLGTPMRSAYAAAKHALHGFFDCLRAEVKKDGIQVSLLTPGYIQTNVAQNAITGTGDPLGTISYNIAHGLPADKAAHQMLRAIAARKYESYIGKMGKERVGLFLNRFFPKLLMNIAPTIVPK